MAPSSGVGEAAGGLGSHVATQQRRPFSQQLSPGGAVYAAAERDARVERVAESLAPKAGAAHSDSTSAFLALLLPVYVPRTITAAGTGLCMVVRPLFARHLGCSDTQSGLVAAAAPLARAPLRSRAPSVREQQQAICCVFLATRFLCCPLIVC